MTEGEDAAAGWGAFFTCLSKSAHVEQRWEMEVSLP